MPPTPSKPASPGDTAAVTLDLAPATSAPSAETSGFWKKLQRGLFMTHTELIERIGAAVEGRGVLDPITLEHLEEALIGADLGVATSEALLDRLKERVRSDEVADVARLREILAEETSALLAQSPLPPRAGAEADTAPRVTLVVGVNGVGKTTSIAKLARRAQLEQRRVLLAAGDTFRAAAIEQLVTWGDRLGIEVVRQKAGSDPAAVVFDAIQAAKARFGTNRAPDPERFGTNRAPDPAGFGTNRAPGEPQGELIVDTAGRLHTKEHLMAELAKVGRVIAREAVGWRQRTILVLDATTGQNAIAQAREFCRIVPVDGILLAKVDGSAKGGMAVAVGRELALPVLYLGVGEGAEDLVDFEPREFAQALLG